MGFAHKKCTSVFFLVVINIYVFSTEPRQYIKKQRHPLEGLMLKLKRLYFSHLMRRTDSFGKILMLVITDTLFQ